MKQSTTRRLLDALAAARQILDVTTATSFDELRNDQLRILGFVKHFEIVGEALNRARKGEQRIEGAIPRLRRYVNLRNQLVHEYDKIDYRLVWQTAQEGVPELVAALESATGGQRSSANEQGQQRQGPDGQTDQQPDNQQHDRGPSDQTRRPSRQRP